MKNRKPPASPAGDTTGKASPARRWSDQRVVNFVETHGKAILLASTALILVVELIEHLVIRRFGEAGHGLFDAALYLLLIPAGLWLLLGLRDRVAKEREKAALDSDQRLAFSQRLGDASGWDELVRRLVEYPHRIAPSACITLYTYNLAKACLQPEVTCLRDGTITNEPPAPAGPNPLPVGVLPQFLLQSAGASPFPNARNYPAPAHLPPNRYDLPVTRQDQLIGVLQLEYPAGAAPSQEEIGALKAVSPVMALALEAGLLQNLAAEQAAASADQRQQIAQTLHDTLAQNISYLRLKLDMLTGENAIQEIGGVLQELERMRDAADEAYEQVRSTLDDLAPAPGLELAGLLLDQAQAIASRAGLELVTSESGTAFALPPAARQQILFILREALHNVEKHARASRVQLQILWLENELLIKVNDDGVGFDGQAAPVEGHYGLWIMRRRAHEIGGELSIGPAGERGVEVTLWLPRPGRTPTAGEAPAVQENDNG